MRTLQRCVIQGSSLKTILVSSLNTHGLSLSHTHTQTVILVCLFLCHGVQVLEECFALFRAGSYERVLEVLHAAIAPKPSLHPILTLFRCLSFFQNAMCVPCIDRYIDIYLYTYHCMYIYHYLYVYHYMIYVDA